MLDDTYIEEINELRQEVKELLIENENLRRKISDMSWALDNYRDTLIPDGQWA